MIPSNVIEKYYLQQTPGAPWLGALRAYSTGCDLYSAARKKQPVPTLTLELGNAQSAREPLVRIVLEQPCDRVTLYLQGTILAGGTGKPGAMFLELRTGCECAEEQVAQAIVSPPSFQDVGEVFTFTSTKLFESIVITGASDEDPRTGGGKVQRVVLRLNVDRAFSCCPIRYGPMAAPVQPPIG